MTLYIPKHSETREVVNRFKFHPPHGDQVRRYECLREQARGLAFLILQNAPPSREQSLALTKLEEAVMWANAAIARNEQVPDAAKCADTEVIKENDKP